MSLTCRAPGRTIPLAGSPFSDPFQSCRGSAFSASKTRVGSPTRIFVRVQKWGRANLSYLLVDAAGASTFENSCSFNFGFTTTFSMTILPGGTGVTLRPGAVVLTGRTLVSETNGI